MSKFLGNPKNIFWEAFLLTIIVFVFGLFIGYAVESSRIEKINDYYSNSELYLIDALALNSISVSQEINCFDLVNTNLKFADRIYEEAKVLNRYDDANKLDNNIKLVYKRYDLLRTLLWSSAINTQQKCEGDFSIVVYMYERETDDLVKKATQTVWSKILTELKETHGDKIILIPISHDESISSLSVLVKGYQISSYPVVIVNDEVIYDLSSVFEIEKYLI